MLRSAKQIREEIAALGDEVEALITLAENEERDISNDEQDRIDQIGDEVTALRESEEKAEKREKLVAEFAAARKIAEKLNRGEIVPNELGGDDYRPQAVKLPAKAKAHRPLRAFRGDDAERSAYVAGRCIAACIANHQPSIEWLRGNGFQNVMSSSSNPAGGFIVPDDMQAALVRLREERGVFPRYANNYPMPSDVTYVPRILSDVTAYWPGEGGEITASDATLGGARIEATKLACLTKVSTELDEDALIDVGDMVVESMAYAMADKIDDAAFNGDGTSTYGGVVGLKNALNASAINDAVSGNVGASTLDFTDFEATVATVGRYPGANFRWYMHSAVYYAACARLLDAAGGNTIQSLEQGVNEMMFLGYPVTFTQVLPSTTGTSASTILAYFGDLRLGSTYGVRRSVRTEVSRDRYFENDLIGIKCTERVGIVIHETGDSIRTRPIVALKTAAS